MTIDELRKELKARFPEIVICGTTAEFYGDDSEGLWVSGEEGYHDDRLIFNYYTEDYKEKNYIMNVLIPVHEFLKVNGFMAEPNDPGTFMIWRTQ